MTPEFNLIQKYFTRPTHHTNLAVGDDAALISITHGMELAISADMLVAGTHFFADCDPYQLGWKSLAVNISDMAAMGANAKWATLAIALPEINEPWLAEFSRGFFACADTFDVDLIGGDTTRGPLTISVQIMGEVPIGKAIKRSGAQVGDDIWVSGQLGSAALGLAYLQAKVSLENGVPLSHDLPPLVSELECCLSALHSPLPRTSLGIALQDIATSCIDISDGLLADIGHILKVSNCNATLELEKIPCIGLLKTNLDSSQFQTYILAGGDDYELCFTAPKSKQNCIIALSRQLNLPISLIGECVGESSGATILYKNKILSLSKKGFDHFG